MDPLNFTVIFLSIILLLAIFVFYKLVTWAKELIWAGILEWLDQQSEPAGINPNIAPAGLEPEGK